MKRIEFAFTVALTLLFCLVGPISALNSISGFPTSEAPKIDGAHSKITVHVYKTGFFSAFAHNHEIESPVAGGTVQLSDVPSVELRVDARKLRVLDPEVSEDTRSQIQEAMRGAQVLDVERFPGIGFRSTKVEASGPDHWIVRGNLALHGKEQLITVDVTLKGEYYRGSAYLKQTDFGITPIRVAGGTVKVKDEVKVEFEIALMK
jgi:polyisoprenoid-binding protein YceI